MDENILNLFKTTIGQYCAACQFVELSIRVLEDEHNGDIQTKEKLEQFAGSKQLSLSEYDSAFCRQMVSLSRIIFVHSCFEDYLHKLYNLIREYGVKNDIQKSENDSWLICVCDFLKVKEVDEDASNLINICEYYRLARNSIHLNNKSEKEARIAYSKIKKEKCNCDAKFRKLAAPNLLNEMTFDDFVMFSRSSIELAEILYKIISFDYKKIVTKIPEAQVKKWKGYLNNENRLKNAVIHYLKVNYFFKDTDISSEILTALKERL